MKTVEWYVLCMGEGSYVQILKQWGMSMDISATVNHDHLKQYMVNFNPIDKDYMYIVWWQ